MTMDNYWPPMRSTENIQYDDGEVARLIKAKINPAIVDFLVERIGDVVDYGLRRPSSSSTAAPNSNKRMRHSHDQDRDEFTSFVSRILRRAEVTMSVILGALVYVERAKPHLRIAIEEWAHHRVFLGSLILASKYLNDSSLKNSHWALCTGVFGKRDIARIEREFLEVLAFQLSVRESDLAPHVEAVRNAMTPETVQLKKMKQADVERKEMELAYVRDGSIAARRKELRSRRAMELAASGHMHHHHRPYPLSRSNSPAAASRGVVSARREWTHHRVPSPMVPSSPISPCDSLDYGSGSSSSSSLCSTSSSSSPCTPPSASNLPPPPVFVPSHPQSHAASPYYAPSPLSAGKFSKGRSGLNLLDHFPSLPALPRFPSLSLNFSSPASSRPPSALPPSAFAPVPLSAQNVSSSSSLGSLPITLYPSCVPFSSGSNRPSPMLPPPPPSSAVPLSASYSNGHQPVVIPRSSASFATGLRRMPVSVL